MFLLWDEWEKKKKTDDKYRQLIDNVIWIETKVKAKTDY